MRPKIGLALSGGGARGTVHVGVLSVLVEAGIPIDFVAGTSVGALVGAAYCAGMPTEQLTAMALTTSWKDLSRPTLSRHGLISFAYLETWIKHTIGDVDIRDLALPFAAVTADLEVGQKVVLREGSVATAVRASCSVPGLVTPVEVNGRLLSDGGILDNMPVDIARDMGADYVIGVDIFVPSAYRRMGALGIGLQSIETMVRHSGGRIEEADCLIVPEIAGHAYHRFSKAQEFIQQGAAATRKALPAIQTALAQLTTPADNLAQSLFSKPVVP
ncbi:MAG: patatin-like phospholipase family protein [Anaerolineae bacterium]|nr:patatin-like phospholipase family protein [Anaerolineae bacterium]